MLMLCRTTVSWFSFITIIGLIMSSLLVSASCHKILPQQNHHHTTIPSSQLPPSHSQNADNKYLPCSSIPHTIPMVNNNSISTAVPEHRDKQNKYMYVAVTARYAEIYKLPWKSKQSGSWNKNIGINFNRKRNNNKNGNSDSKNDGDQFHIFLDPYQILKECTDTSSIALTNDGIHLAVGCGNSNTNIYIFDGDKYIFKQTLQNSYYKNGAKIAFSSDGHYLFTIQSPKQINYYTLGSNLYQLTQQIPVAVEAVTLFSLTSDSKYFSIIQQNSTSLLLSIFYLENNKYVQNKSNHKPISQLVSSLTMNNNQVIVIMGTFTSNCSSLVYKIVSNDGRMELNQQIFQTVPNLCIMSGYLNRRNQLVLSNGYFTSIVYRDSGKGFERVYDLYHEAMGVPVHTEIRLIDTIYQHLVIYTGVELNFYCPGIQQQVQA